MMPHEWADIAYFRPEEFDYPEQVSSKLVHMLDRVRELAGVSIYITSDFRPGDDKSHGRGLAVDVTDDTLQNGVSSHWRKLITEAALQVGFRRIGLYNLHTHLDIDSSLPQDVLWLGTSR